MQYRFHTVVVPLWRESLVCEYFVGFFPFFSDFTPSDLPLAMLKYEEYEE